MNEKNWANEGADWVKENLGDTLNEVNATAVFAKYLFAMVDLCDHQYENSKDRSDWWLKRSLQLSKVIQDAGIIKIKATGSVFGEINDIVESMQKTKEESKDE